MIVKHVAANVIDVFTGIGWNDWCRFKIEKVSNRKYLHKLAGTFVPADMMVMLRKQYT